MARLILLDSGLVGLACTTPSPSVEVFNNWLKRMIISGTDVLVPEISRFEVRRELLRLRATAQLKRLDSFSENSAAALVTSEAWERAGEFWALVRQSGKPTAAPDALDGDAILAAVAATIGRPDDEVIIATTNLGHLGRFPGIDARKWEDIS